jgi:hypothetical protein
MHGAHSATTPKWGVYEFFLTREHRTFRLTDSSGAKIVVFGTLGDCRAEF